MDFSNLKNCSSALIGGFNKIYALNGFRLPDDKSCFNKYLPLSRKHSTKYIFPFV